MQYEPKSKGITYLRHAIIAQKKRSNNKFVTIPMQQAEEIIVQSADFKSVQGQFVATQNSVRAASLTLCIPAKELCERLNSPTPANLLSDLCEARNKLASLQRIGDRLAQQSDNAGTVSDWNNARKL